MKLLKFFRWYRRVKKEAYKSCGKEYTDKMSWRAWYREWKKRPWQEPADAFYPNQTTTGV